MTARSDQTRKQEQIAPFLIVGEGRFAMFLVAALSDEHISHRQTDHIPDSLSSFCGVILALDVVERTTALQVTAACLAEHIPYLPVLLMGEVVQIGPMVLGGNAPCLNCSDIRMSGMTGRSCLDANWPLNVEFAKFTAGRIVKLMANWNGTIQDYAGQLNFVWTNGSESSHQVLRTLACNTCNVFPPHHPYETPITLKIDPESGADMGHILTQVDQLVDPVTGPIRSVEKLAVTTDLPKIEHSVAQLVDPGWVQHGISTLDCGGNELNADDARAAAVGEAIERGCATQFRPEGLQRGVWNDLRNHAVAPLTFDLFLHEDRIRRAFRTNQSPQRRNTLGLGHSSWSKQTNSRACCTCFRSLQPARSRNSK